MLVWVFEVFSLTHQWCDNLESRFAMMFREDSQIDFAKENVILNVSLRPLLPPACTFHIKTNSQLVVTTC